MKHLSITKLWGGNFNQQPSGKVLEFISGRDVKPLQSLKKMFSKDKNLQSFLEIKKLEFIKSVSKLSKLLLKKTLNYPNNSKLSFLFEYFSNLLEQDIKRFYTSGKNPTDLLFCIAILLKHLSEIAQNLIILSTTEFAEIKLADKMCAGSSIMPQKKNPVTLEIIRAKSCLINGLFYMSSEQLKIPQTDSFDFITVDAVNESLPAIYVLTKVIESLKVIKHQTYEN
jgi:hypothetical protein